MSVIAMPPGPLGIATSPAGGGPTPHRWTLQDYQKLAHVGLLDGLRTILINGEILTMTMPGPQHDIALNLTFAFLQSLCPVGYHVRNQQSFNIGTDTDPGPDLAIVPGTIRDYTARAPSTALMIVEVADSSLFMDTTTKAECYATAGVAEYWVIGLEHRQLIVFRDPLPLPKGLGATAYKTHLTFNPTDRISPLAAPATSILVSELLP
jgi:Uma2 family endonuclease